MSININGITNIENVVVVNSKTGEQTELLEVYAKLGGETETLVWAKPEEITILKFSGIDKNGAFSWQEEYDGIPVAYAVGTGYLSFQYKVYKLVEPTPADASGYSGKYVKNESDGTYVVCSVTTDADGNKILSSPTWAIVGETPCYTQSTEYLRNRVDDPHYEFVSKSENFEYNNGLNSEYFPGVDLTTFYGSYEGNGDAPDIGIETIDIPDEYRGKPVIGILQDAFYAFYTRNNAPSSHSVTYHTKNVRLGKNIEFLESTCFVEMCRIVENPTNTFILNDKIKRIEISALNGVFSSTSVGNKSAQIKVPSSVERLHAEAFSNHIATMHGNYMYKVFISSPKIELLKGMNTESLAENTDYLVFERTVKEISGCIRTGSSSSVKAEIVFKHQKNDLVTFDIESPKTAVECIIYTDCDAVLNYDWAAKNHTVTFKSLSEYEGD